MALKVVGSSPISHPIKNQVERLGFFICAERHNLVCVQSTQLHLTVRSTSLPFAAQMNEVEALPQMMLQQVAKDVMLCINDVALRANGAIAIRFIVPEEIDSPTSFAP